MKRRRSTRARGVVLVAALLLAGTGCAYYNTFHTARKYFRDADRQYEASGLEHPSPGVLDLYARSIERSEKVLTNYSDSKWVDDALHLIGMAYLRREEYEKGISTFEELIEKHPKSKLIPDAIFGIGLCQLGRGDWEEGEQTLNQLLTERPNYKKRSEVVYNIARSAARRRDYRRAVAGFSRLLAGGKPEGIDLTKVYQARGEAYLALAVTDSALTDFNAAVRLANVPEQRFELQLLAGESLEQLGRLDDAFNLYSQLEREISGPNERPRTLLRVGRVENARGRHQEALAVYARTIKDFPASSFAAEAQYQIGFTEEIYREDLDAAKDAYGKVRDIAPSSQFAELAEERKQSIELYGQYRSQMTAGSEDEEKAEAALMLAEVSLFRLRKVDEALAAYQEVEHDFPQSSFAPKAAYAVAWIQEQEKGDSLAAMASYRYVYETYPETEYGVQAGVRAGLLAADSLSIYLGRVLSIKAAADSAEAAARALAAADSLAAVAAGDSLAVAAGDSLAVAAGDSLAVAAGDSLAVAAGDSLALVAADSAAFAARDSVVAALRDSLAPGRHPAKLDSLDSPPLPPGVLPRSIQAPPGGPRPAVELRDPESGSAGGAPPAPPLPDDEPEGEAPGPE